MTQDLAHHLVSTRLQGVHARLNQRTVAEGVRRPRQRTELRRRGQRDSHASADLWGPREKLPHPSLETFWPHDVIPKQEAWVGVPSAASCTAGGTAVSPWAVSLVKEKHPANSIKNVSQNAGEPSASWAIPSAALCPESRRLDHPRPGQGTPVSPGLWPLQPLIPTVRGLVACNLGQAQDWQDVTQDVGTRRLHGEICRGERAKLF